MRKYVFKFKRFGCRHERSSLKIGVDAVVLGAWVDVVGSRRILDVGTGCGVIALILAQRAEEANVEGIDIDAPSVEEAALNFATSPWSDRLAANMMDFLSMREGAYNLIISNPPYFDSGVDNPESSRLIARHQGALNPVSLLLNSGTLLTCRGRVAMIVPYDQADGLSATASGEGWKLIRECRMRGHADAPYKRMLMEFGRGEEYPEVESTRMEELTLEHRPGVPTEQYLTLCHNFYLKF